MTQHNVDAYPSHEHEEVWALLPWYVNGTLEPQERAMVDVHLETCSACQAELTHCRALAAAVRTTEEEAWSPSPTAFARLRARLDSAESTAQEHIWWGRWRAWYHRYREALQDTATAVRWLLAAQSALVIVLASVVVWQGTGTSAGLYRTLTGASDQAPRHQGQLRVVFADDVREKELRTLLTSVSGTIVAGPSPLGVYTVQVPLSEDTAEAVATALAVLRAHPQVRLAEPAPHTPMLRTKD